MIRKKLEHLITIVVCCLWLSWVSAVYFMNYPEPMPYLSFFLSVFFPLLWFFIVSWRNE